MLIIEGSNKDKKITITEDTRTVTYTEKEGLMIHDVVPDVIVTDRNGSKHKKKGDFRYCVYFNHGEWFIRADGPFGEFSTTYFSTICVEKNGPYFFSYDKGVHF
jgi:hypothetical protein